MLLLRGLVGSQSDNPPPRLLPEPRPSRLWKRDHPTDPVFLKEGQNRSRSPAVLKGQGNPRRPWVVRLQRVPTPFRKSLIRGFWAPHLTKRWWYDWHSFLPHRQHLSNAILCIPIQGEPPVVASPVSIGTQYLLARTLRSHRSSLWSLSPFGGSPARICSMFRSVLGPFVGDFTALDA